jgi:hypothetical protein
VQSRGDGSRRSAVHLAIGLLIWIPLPAFAAGGTGHGVDPEFFRSFIILAIWAFLALVAALLWPISALVRRRRERKELAKKQEATGQPWSSSGVPQPTQSNAIQSAQKTESNVTGPASGGQNPPRI